MELNKQDPRLMDYVLGELDAEETRALESALERPQNAEALREVEALRGVVQAAATALEKDSPAAFPEGLSPEQRDNVLARAEHPMVPFPARQIRRWGKWLAAAAVLVL
jgi:anti-sigma factor RsiW